MYTVGLIKTDSPRILINPQTCKSVKELHAWLKAFLNDDKFNNDSLLTIEEVQAALDKNEPGIVHFEGVHLALLFGKDEIIFKATDEFKYFE